MIKTVRREITIFIIISMLVQLLAGVMPALAEDPGDFSEEPEFVPLLDVTLSPGEAAGTTSATVTGHVYGSLVVNITDVEVATPCVGDTAPSAGDYLIVNYEPGADIAAGVETGSFLQTYDVDMEDENRIVAFYQAELTEDAIKGNETAGNMMRSSITPLSSGGIPGTYELGPSVTGTLYSDGELVISGSGAMNADASFFSDSNSIISVVKDVERHWAREEVNDMASRLVVSGVSEEGFEPDKDITRGEFAAITVRALGLMRPGTGRDVFSDVSKDAWYYDAVTIAYGYNLIDGYGDGKFGPMDRITREQAMAIAARAMKISGLKAGMADSEAAEVLAGFTDANSAADYAKTGIAACVKTGIVSGRSSTTLAPGENVTRAEAAAIIRRLLQQSGLI